MLTGASFDGGQTWAFGMAAFSRCAGGNAANGGDYPRSSDPWVSFGPDGSPIRGRVLFALALAGLGIVDTRSSRCTLPKTWRRAVHITKPRTRKETRGFALLTPYAALAGSSEAPAVSMRDGCTQAGTKGRG